MKIALVRSKFNHFGGAEKFLERALRALVSVGAEPSLVCQSWTSDDVSTEYSIIKTQKPKGLTRKSRAEHFEALVKEVVKKNAFELVQTHERISGFDIYRAGDGVHRTWMTQRNKDIGWLRRWLTQFDPFHRYQLEQEKKLFEAESLRAVVCNSNMVKREILSLFNIDEKKIHVIYNGIDTQKFRPPTADEKSQAKRNINLPTNIPTMIFLGSGFERKGLKHLLYSMALCPDVFLLVVGSDKKINRYEKIAQALNIQNRIIFTGPQKDPLPFLWAADGMVFPTLYDPCPNAVLEGMACGLGIITSPYCGAMELLDKTAGACVSPWDHKGMAQAINKFKNPDFADHAGKASRDCTQNLNLNNMGQQLLKLYQSLIKQA